jgi:hypothetical protein
LQEWRSFIMRRTGTFHPLNETVLTMQKNGKAFGGSYTPSILFVALSRGYKASL